MISTSSHMQKIRPIMGDLQPTKIIPLDRAFLKSLPMRITIFTIRESTTPSTLILGWLTDKGRLFSKGNKPELGLVRRTLWGSWPENSLTWFVCLLTNKWTSMRPQWSWRFKRGESTTSQTCWRASTWSPRPSRTRSSGSVAILRILITWRPILQSILNLIKTVHNKLVTTYKWQSTPAWTHIIQDYPEWEWYSRHWGLMTLKPMPTGIRTEWIDQAILKLQTVKLGEETCWEIYKNCSLSMRTLIKKFKNTKPSSTALPQSSRSLMMLSTA